MTRVGALPRVNPLSTRFVEPGAIAYRFPNAHGLAALVRRLEETRGWGQLVGPHGSGKSTLLATLLGMRPNHPPGFSPSPLGGGVGEGSPLSSWRLRLVRLNTSQRALPPWVWDVPAPRSLLAIDGFEQLGFLTRLRVKRYCRRHGCGLLVTAHRSVGLPDLYHTAVTPAAAADVVAALVPPGGEWVLDGFDIAARLSHHRGSLRAVLFELYDRWAARKSG